MSMKVVTTSQVCTRLGISRQFFYASGLRGLLENHGLGATHPLLFSEQQVETLAEWLHLRKELIAAGKLSGRAPVANPNFETVVAKAREL